MMRRRKMGKRCKRRRSTADSAERISSMVYRETSKLRESSP